MANPKQVRNDKGRFAKTEDGEIVPNENPRAVAEPPFASVVELQRSYINHFTKILRRSDMALRKDRKLQRQMRRDPDVMSPLYQRQSAVALLEYEIKPEDENDPVQVEQAETLEKLLKTNLHKPFEFFMALLDAVWYGPAAVQVTPEMKNGFVVPGEWMPIHSDTLAFTTYGDLTMYVGLKYEGEKKTGPYGMIHTLDEDERELVVLHTHGRQGPDYEEPEEAAYVYAGRGIRDTVWFYWMMKQQALQNWLAWIERYGQGIRVGTYPDGNHAAKEVMEEVLQNLVGDVSVVIPRQPGENRDAYSIEVQEPSPGNAKTFADLIEGYLAGQIKELIIGQTATTEATSTGLGSSVGDQHAETFKRIIRADAMNLADTLTRELVWKYHEMNFGETAYKPRFEFSLEKNDPQEFMEAVRGFVEMGGEVSQRQARDILGLTEPEEGEPVLSSQQQQEEMGEPGQEENPLAALLGGGQPRSEAFKKYTYALKPEQDKDTFNCGTGSGGFKPGNDCAGGDGSSKSSSTSTSELAAKVDAAYPQSPTTFPYPKTVSVDENTDWAKIARTTKKNKETNAYGVTIEIDGKRNGSLEWWRSTEADYHSGWIIARKDAQNHLVGESVYTRANKADLIDELPHLGNDSLSKIDRYNYSGDEEYDSHVIHKAETGKSFY